MCGYLKYKKHAVLKGIEKKKKVKEAKKNTKKTKKKRKLTTCVYVVHFLLRGQSQWLVL